MHQYISLSTIFHSFRCVFFFFIFLAHMTIIAFIKCQQCVIACLAHTQCPATAIHAFMVLFSICFELNEWRISVGKLHCQRIKLKPTTFDSIRMDLIGNCRLNAVHTAHKSCDIFKNKCNWLYSVLYMIWLFFFSSI